MVYRLIALPAEAAADESILPTTGETLIIDRMAKSQQPLPSTLYDESYFLTACEGFQEYHRV